MEVNMARQVRSGPKRAFVNPRPADPPLAPLAPKDAVKVEFARRLQAAMVAKGWRQSDLARRAEKYLPANKKFGRDSISLYIRGKTLPGPVFLEALCKALEKEPDDLLPTRGMPAAGENNPPLDVKDAGDGNAWLRVNQAVPWNTAVAILRLLRGDGPRGENDGAPT
jgi:transcriptional regulator with XRE-family HTH domain